MVKEFWYAKERVLLITSNISSVKGLKQDMNSQDTLLGMPAR